MKLIKTSKVGKRGGSLNVVIPSAIADLFEINEGITVKWIATVGEGTPSLVVEKEEKKSSE